MSRSKQRERHLFPTGDSFMHSSSAYCRCKPSRRADDHSTVYIHSVHDPERASMKEPEYRDTDGVFTVVMPRLLQARFESWLRREHLQMAVAPSSSPNTYVVLARKR